MRTSIKKQNQQPTGVKKVGELNYPIFPFSPDQNYPELRMSGIDPNNGVYQSVRTLFIELKMDSDHIGTPRWNPFGDFINPGSFVVIKPNWVRDFNPVDSNLDSLLTHTSIVRVALDYVAIALMGRGRVTIADAPINNCDFERLAEVTKIRQLISTVHQKLYPDIEWAIVDMRKTVTKRNGEIIDNRPSANTNQKGDPLGYTTVDIGNMSLLSNDEKITRRYRVTNYDHRLLQQHHRPGKHEYLIANTILSADTIINLPKLKTHCKAGLTGAMKNMIGANGHKEFLPHYTTGATSGEGDQYPDKSRLKQLFDHLYDTYWSKYDWPILVVLMKGLQFLSHLVGEEDIWEGDWFGNKTVARTTIDINRIIYHYDRENGFSDKPARRIFTLVDGIIAGEGDGPLRPQRKTSGILIAGTNPLTIDIAIAQLIGYDPITLPTIELAGKEPMSPFVSAPINLNQLPVVFNGKLTTISKLPDLKFIRPTHWEKL